MPLTWNAPGEDRVCPYYGVKMSDRGDGGRHPPCLHSKWKMEVGGRVDEMEWSGTAIVPSCLRVFVP